MKKVDRSLSEVRRWKRKVAQKTRHMSASEAVTYFRNATKKHAKRLSLSRKNH